LLIKISSLYTFLMLKMYFNNLPSSCIICFGTRYLKGWRLLWSQCCKFVYDKSDWYMWENYLKACINVCPLYVLSMGLIYAWEIMWKLVNYYR